MAGTGVTMEVISPEGPTGGDEETQLEEGSEIPMAEYHHTPSNNLYSLRDEINSLRQEILSRDILLQKLEESVTKLSEDLTMNISPLKDYVIAKMREETDEAGSELPALSEGGTPRDGDQETEEEGNNVIRNRGLDAMMNMTEILENTEQKTSQVRGFYEKIYDASPMTSFILEFLERNRGVKVLIDCDSWNVNRFMKRLVNHDGEKCAGTALPAFVDFFGHKVYLGGFVGSYFVVVNTRQVSKTANPISTLAQSLAQLAIYLIFDNRGFPYVHDDELNEMLCEKIVEEALQKKSSGVCIDDMICAALNMKTPVGRELSLISVVPGLLVQYGFKGGMTKLYEQIPLLPLYYMQQVLPKMMSDSRV